MQAKETRSGTIAKLFYENNDTGWSAGVLRCEDDSSCRFAGEVLAPVGSNVTLTGVFEDTKYGRQLVVSGAKVKIDDSPEGILRLLSDSPAFKGIGKSRAASIVSAATNISMDHGVSVSELLATEEEAERELIADRAGVSYEIVANACDAWKANRELFEVSSALVDMGWTPGQATKIYRKHVTAAVTIVKADPYKLIGQIDRFGFKIVDAVASGPMKIAEDDPRRMVAGVTYCVEAISDNGSTRTTRSEVIDAARGILRPNTFEAEDLIETYLDDAVDKGQIIAEEMADGSIALMLPRIAKAEFMLFSWLTKAMKTEASQVPINFDDEAVGSLTPTQLASLKGICNYQAALISGGAGTGKTFTMEAVYRVFRASGKSVALCAPTGKAAKKLQASTGFPAGTVHKLLEFYFDEVTGSLRPSRGPGNPIDADLIIVDEASMVDVELGWKLLRAVRPGARILLVGDHNQIPSVSPGAILRDLLASRDQFPESIHILDQVHRQAGELGANTKAILEGRLVRGDSEEWGVEVMDRATEKSTIPARIATIVDFLGTLNGVDPAFDIQVLTPTKKGPLGTSALNAVLQRVRQSQLGNLMPPQAPIVGDPKPIVGDRVIWTKNDYDLDLFNGTQAIVTKIHDSKAPKEVRNCAEIQLDETGEDGKPIVKLIPANKRINMMLAYAMTIHKAQGSEWPYVIAVASMAHSFQHDRNLLYTAASRASQSLTLIGDLRGMKSFAWQTKSEKRNTIGQLVLGGWVPSFAKTEEVA